MKRTIPFTVAIVFSLVLYGCGTPAGSDSKTQSGSSATIEGSGTSTDSGHATEGGAQQTDMEKMKLELAKLSPEDAMSAEKQHMCPVSDEMLGTMGAPIKVDVNGQQVWICCEGCRKPLLEKPSEYLAKLK